MSLSKAQNTCRF